MNINMLFNVNMLYALVMATAIGGVAGYLGSLMMSKRMALIAGPLGHLSLPGVALALLYGFDVSLGALIFLCAGVVLIWILQQQTIIPTEALTALVFSSSISVAFLFLPQKESSRALLGDISQISIPTCLISLVVSAIIFFVIKTIYHKMVLMSISSDLAHVQGIPVARYHFIYFICIALMIALGVRIIGGLMTAALVAIPAATSRILSHRLFTYAYLSFVFGILSCVCGIIASQLSGIAVGPLIVISSTLFFASALAYSKLIT